jgi:hypothetical protein
VLSNAVAAALSSLGVEPRDLPLTPPRVWELIQKAKRDGRDPDPSLGDKFEILISPAATRGRGRKQ